MSGIGGWARAAPDAPAFISTSGSTTFAELDERHRRLAGFLSEAGVTEGDRVAILAKNRNEIVEIAAGVLRAGIIPVTINSLLSPPEIHYILEDSTASILFTDRLEDMPVDRVVTFGAAYERCLAGASARGISDFVRSRPMHYTSGTTGLPKGVYVPVVDDDGAQRISEAFRTTWGLRHDEIHLVCSPLAHSAPLRYSIRTLEAGGAVVIPERFDAEQTLAAIELFGVTSAFMVPTHLERIVALGRKKLARYDLSSIRMLCHAGAPIRESTKRAVIDIFPPGSVWEFYSATEGHATRISSQEWLRKPGSVGQPQPDTKVYVMSEDFEPLPRGEVGQIWVLHDRPEPWEYWGDPEKTAAAWRDGAFTVGDLGYLDADGYLYIAGRMYDTIITGGVNVYPAEVEAVLGTHPDIAEVVVFGVPDEEWGQVVSAKFVPVPGATIDPDALHAWAKERLASFKCPRTFEVVDALEHTATGKVRRPRP
jgi:long-chain acyl-CoA synthetase